jgi:hypothetical protein
LSYEYTISSYTHVNGILYFAYRYSNVIWRSDGTECGTFNIDVGLKDIIGLDAIGSNLFISGRHHYYGYELFAFNISNVAAPSCPEASSARQETATEVTNEEESKHVTYAPNPFDRDFTFVVNSNHQSTAEVAVYDMTGHPLMLDLLETNKPHQFGNNWNQGLYIIRITVDGKVTYKRVVKGRQ